MGSAIAARDPSEEPGCWLRRRHCAKRPASTGRLPVVQLRNARWLPCAARWARDAFARAWEAGRRLPLDEIVADALAPAEPAGLQIRPNDSCPVRSPGGSARWPC